VIPLSGTQIQLKKYLASLRLRGGSSVCLKTLQEVAKNVSQNLQIPGSAYDVEGAEQEEENESEPVLK